MVFFTMHPRSGVLIVPPRPLQHKAQPLLTLFLCPQRQKCSQVFSPRLQHLVLLKRVVGSLLTTWICGLSRSRSWRYVLYEKLGSWKRLHFSASKNHVITGTMVFCINKNERKTCRGESGGRIALTASQPCDKHRLPWPSMYRKVLQKHQDQSIEFALLIVLAARDFWGIHVVARKKL